MRIIGLTGGIGTGKSTVSKFLLELGAYVLEADKVGHEALEPASPVYSEVIATFGKKILTPGGKISRKKLGRIVFASPVNLRRLNRIVHPWIFATLRERLEGLRRQGAKVVVVEAALLIEANWLPLVDEVWVTVAPGETIVKRLREREGLSEEESLSRIRSQMPQEERLRYAAHLSFPNDYFDCVGMSFAFRNLSYRNPLGGHALAEVLRVLKPGGRFVIVESSQPKSRLVRWLFHLYLRFFVARVGYFLSGNKGAYRYLAESATHFLTPEEVKNRLVGTGFREVFYRSLLLGVAAIHVTVR